MALKHEVNTAVVEATAVYRKPVYYGLEGLIGEPLAVNATHVKRPESGWKQALRV
jgi:hypothetical protein